MCGSCLLACGKIRTEIGVSHIDVDEVLQNDQYCKHIVEYSASKNIEISALAFYPNTMDGNTEKREINIAHLKKVICASAKLGVGMVTTFIGRDQEKNIEELLYSYVAAFLLARRAESYDFSCAVEADLQHFTK